MEARSWESRVQDEDGKVKDEKFITRRRALEFTPIHFCERCEKTPGSENGNKPRSIYCRECKVVRCVACDLLHHRTLSHTQEKHHRGAFQGRITAAEQVQIENSRGIWVVDAMEVFPRGEILFRKEGESTVGIYHDTEFQVTVAPEDEVTLHETESEFTWDDEGQKTPIFQDTQGAMKNVSVKLKALKAEQVLGCLNGYISQDQITMLKSALQGKGLAVVANSTGHHMESFQSALDVLRLNHSVINSGRALDDRANLLIMLFKDDDTSRILREILEDHRGLWTKHQSDLGIGPGNKEYRENPPRFADVLGPRRGVHLSPKAATVLPRDGEDYLDEIQALAPVTWLGATQMDHLQGTNQELDNFHCVFCRRPVSVEISVFGVPVNCRCKQVICANKPIFLWNGPRISMNAAISAIRACEVSYALEQAKFGNELDTWSWH
jgi:hypothetical protein